MRADRLPPPRSARPPSVLRMPALRMPALRMPVLRMPVLRMPVLHILVPGLLLAAAGASADPYQLTPGDAVSLVVAGQPEPVEVRVDLDGAIRVLDAGGVEVAGLTLDEAVAAIEARLAESGLLVAPNVSLTVAAYAPVVVAGDVRDPGRYDHFPHMTVETALALSGGDAGGPSELQTALAAADVGTRLDTLAIEIASEVLGVARLQAELRGEDRLELDAAAWELVPSDGLAALDRLARDEAAILVNEAERKRELLVQWDAELGALRDGLTLLDRRLALQQEVADRYAADLVNAQTLQDRGLQTASALSQAQQLEAGARAGLLEIDSARAAAQRAIAEAERQRGQVVRQARERALADLRTARVALESALVRHRRARQEEEALLREGTSQLTSGGDAVSFEVVDGRTGAAAAATPATPLRPGDTLIVRILGEAS